MTYFDLPRLHIKGRFFCDPSSENNDPEHYKPEVERPAPWQMPKGMHYFRFFDCMVMTAVDEDGKSASQSNIIGASFQSTDNPVPGKIVDIDVYQQGVSELYGVKISLNADSGGELKGTMRRAVLNGCWFEAVLPTRGWEQAYGSAGSYGADTSAVGGFQTVIEVKREDWSFDDQGVMEQLRKQCAIGENSKGEAVYLLSFKFVLDGYWNVKGTIDYQKGRFVGTIGPCLKDDPTETPGARWLEARKFKKGSPWFVPQFHRAPFFLDEKHNTLLIDWAACLSRDEFAGKPVDLGDVRAVVVTPDGPQDLDTFVIDEFTYKMSAGISTIALTEIQTKLLAENPLQLFTSRDDIGDPCIFAEAADGISISTQNRSIRLTSEPERSTSAAEATAVIRKFGKPLVGKQPNIAIIPVKGSTPGATVPPNNPGDTPQADGALGATVGVSDANGVSTISFKALKDPGYRTTQLDGQLYFVYVYFGDEAPSKPPLQESQLTVLIWSTYKVIEKPTWDDIKQLMIPYAKLYPGMSEKVNIADESAFVFYANNPDASFFLGPNGKFEIPGHPEIQDGTIPFLLTLPVSDPGYMPVSRDLSPPKVETILNFISIEQAKIKAAGGIVASSKPWKGAKV